MAEKAGWDYLTDDEKRRIASKLVDVKDASKLTKDDLQRAGVQFNSLTSTDGKTDMDRVNTAINFIYAAGGNKGPSGSAVWQDITKITEIGRSSLAMFVISDNEKFKADLKQEGFAVNPGWPMAGDHKHDSARFITEYMKDTSLHLANDAYEDKDKGPNYYFAHFDPNAVTSKETLRELECCPFTTTRKLIQMGRDHSKLGNASPAQVRDYLKRSHKMPSNR